MKPLSTKRCAIRAVCLHCVPLTCCPGYIPKQPSYSNPRRPVQADEGCRRCPGPASGCRHHTRGRYASLRRRRAGNPSCTCYPDLVLFRADLPMQVQRALEMYQTGERNPASGAPDSSFSQDVLGDRPSAGHDTIARLHNVLTEMPDSMWERVTSGVRAAAMVKKGGKQPAKSAKAPARIWGSCLRKIVMHR